MTAELPGSPDGASGGASTVVLHSSWRGLLSGVFGGSVVFAAGSYSTAATGGAWGSLVILAVGLCILAVMLFDFPVSSRFDAHGATRRPLLRRQRISWDRVDRLTRTRPGLSARSRTFAPGGLVAEVGRRRYLLVDQCESFDEFTELSGVLGDAADDLSVHDLVVPPSDTDPTWTYRRARWRPQSD